MAGPDDMPAMEVSPFDTGPEIGTLDAAQLMEEQQANSLYDQSLIAGDPPLLEPGDPDKLTDMERHSGLWLKLRRKLENDLLNLRISNDDHRSEVETADIRGKIKQTKEFLALGETEVRIAPDGPGSGY
jgi:hypothetical protein